MRQLLSGLAGGGGAAGGGGGGALGILGKLLDPLGLFGKGGGSQQAGGAKPGVQRSPLQLGPQLQLPAQQGQPRPFVSAGGSGGGMNSSTADLQKLLAMLNQGSGG